MNERINKWMNVCARMFVPMEANDRGEGSCENLEHGQGGSVNFNVFICWTE